MNNSLFSKKQKGLSASEIKYIAILAMLIDHIAWKFIPIDTPLAQIMHMIGRITAPIMCFFISEGYHYTHNIKKYITRLAIFAVISHFAFSYYEEGSLNNIFALKTSVIYTLLFCLLSVVIYNKNSWPMQYRYVGILIILLFADFGDWGSTAVLFTLAFEIGRDNKKNQLIGYAAVAFICNIFPLLKILIFNPDMLSLQIFQMGVLLPLPLLLLYNGTKGGGKVSKWFFYIFYPVHLIILGYLYFNY